MIYPWNLPNPIAGGTWPDNPSASGGEAQNGMEQNIFNMSMKLRARWTVALRRASDVLAARQFQGRMKGKSNLCLVPLFDGKRISWPVSEFGIKQSPLRTRERSLDGTIYEYPAIPDASDVYAALVFDADYHDTQITVLPQQGGPPLGGQWFCLGGARSYLIEEVEALALGRYRLTFTPPLRAPASSSDVVDFAKLYCLMNQTKSDQGVQVLDGIATAVIEYEFVEGFEDDALTSGSGS